MVGKEEQILDELISIKKLLVMFLYSAGIPSEEIDKAAKIGAANIRGLCSKKKAKLTVNISKELE
ncbi:MAG: hypothetical protein ACHQQQ_15235 [Bacteroidota bacterium]